MSAGSPGGPVEIEGRMERIAVLGTPRAGNTWLRGLLAHTLDLQELTAHEPDQVDWAALPPRCVLQIHWGPTEPFRAALAHYGFRVVSPARHPLDVLLSTLNYAYYMHDPAACAREVCPTCAILGVSPRSAPLLDYSRGPFARNALALSRDWWARPEAVRVRYEDLFVDTAGVLRRLVAELGTVARVDPGEVAARFAIEPLRQRDEVLHYHYWQGRPGLWRSLLPVAEAQALADPHRDCLAAHGYRCDPDPALDPLRADLTWYRLQLESTRMHLRLEREKHRSTRRTLESVQAQLDSVHHILWLERQQHDQAIATMSRTDAVLPGPSEPAGPRRSGSSGPGPLAAAG
jgi:hypothetical protein